MGEHLVGEFQHSQPEQRSAAVQAAADELADHLKHLADQLGSTSEPTRIPYGPGRLGNSLRRRSPEGFVVDPVNLQMVLPDGRLWSYSRSDAHRFPVGRIYDARTDHVGFVGGRSFPGGTEFNFLGAVIGKYTFGFANGDAASSPNGLYAIVSEGREVRHVRAEDAFADLAHTLSAATRPTA
jgi:hypothetical protein